MPVLELPSANVAFAEYGQGPPLLLFHANPGDHHDFDAVIPDLARRHRVVALDWPGYGDSPPPRAGSSASAMLFADVATEVVDALSIRDAVVIGCSVGGYAAIRVALARPNAVGTLVLVGSGGFTTHSVATRMFCRAMGTEWIARTVATSFARRYLRARNDATRAILARTEEGRRVPSRVAVTAAVWRSFLDARYDLRNAAREVSVPTLLAWGRHDPVLPLENDGRLAARTIPRAKLVEFETGHMPFAEDPSTFLETLAPFLHAPRRDAPAVAEHP